MNCALHKFRINFFHRHIKEGDEMGWTIDPHSLDAWSVDRLAYDLYVTKIKGNKCKEVDDAKNRQWATWFSVL